MRNGSLPAQPCSIEPNAQGAYFGEKTVHCTGLTKRELFAAMAMQGLAARLDMTSEDRAIYAVECADDLLAALEAVP